MSQKIHNILFMCVANSARSQMAEGLARTILGSEFVVQSAGSQPKAINPWAVRVMSELQIDISKQYSKSVEKLNSQFIENLNYVITLCTEEVCPTIITKKAQRLHWPLPDPAILESLSEEEVLQKFRFVRDSLVKEIENLKIICEVPMITRQPCLN